MPPIKTFAVILLSCPGLIMAFDFPPPSTLDLKAAYCLGVRSASEPSLKQTEDWLKANFPNDATKLALINARRREADNLKNYVFGRLPNVEPTGILIAITRGKQDYEIMGQEVRNCTAASSPCGQNPDEATLECYKQCAKDYAPTLKKTQQCEDLSWFPY